MVEHFITRLALVMDCFGQSGWCGEILSGGVECRCQRGAYCRWIVADNGQKECSFELSDWRTWSNGCSKIHRAVRWQNIHTEQFEPRLRRYAQSQLNCRRTVEMFNPTLPPRARNSQLGTQAERWTAWFEKNWNEKAQAMQQLQDTGKCATTCPRTLPSISWLCPDCNCFF